MTKKTAEEILTDLMYITYYACNAVLLLIEPNGTTLCGMRERDLSKIDAERTGEEMLPDERDITILKGKIAEGYIPVGVTSVDISHPVREQRAPSGYLSDEETNRIFNAYGLGVYAQFVAHQEWAEKNPESNLFFAQAIARSKEVKK